MHRVQNTGLFIPTTGITYTGTRHSIYSNAHVVQEDYDEMLEFWSNDHTITDGWRALDLEYLELILHLPAHFV